LVALRLLVALAALAVYIACAALREMWGQILVEHQLLYTTLAVEKAAVHLLLLLELILAVVVGVVAQEITLAQAALVFVLSMNTIKVMK
jgi:hypothetical protein